ncbi:MAG: DNA replication/repair protein RecF [Clostridia bacterium]|nr:DNA replication/repair protein RecF [Clostridia bacterium]
MYLQKLKLTNFRNYENLELEFNNNVNVFVGDNAHGKTNILESIYVSAITKSYRTGKDIECISFEKEFFRNVHTYIDESNKDKKIEVEVFLDTSNKKQIKEDNLKVNRYSDFIGKIPIVVFSPDNMNIVKGSPNNRRKFLDILISQISKKYVISLQEYNKLIKLKNDVLKLEKEKIDFTYLDIIDEQIAEKIEYISTKRYEYVDKVEKEAVKIQKELSKGDEILNLKYISEFENKNKEEVLNILLKSRENDIFRKTSNKTIAHDDFLVFVNNKEVNKYGSQGQNRTALLALKLAEFEILKEIKATIPLILLDDVFSELDKGRINYLIEYLKDYQVFITTTEVDSIDKVEDKTIFKVKNGTVEKLKN